MAEGKSHDESSAAIAPDEHQARLLLAGLRDIARGDWNRYRKPGKDLTAREHAERVLHDAGFKVRP